jgi:hypothetical protein
MSYRRSLSCLAAAMLLAAAFAVPTAVAMPTDPTGPAQDKAAAPTPHPRAVPPTWPENPAPINRAPAQPVSTGDDGGSDDFPVVLVAVIGGVLVLCGGLAVTAMRVRARHAH